MTENPNQDTQNADEVEDQDAEPTLNAPGDEGPTGTAPDSGKGDGHSDVSDR